MKKTRKILLDLELKKSNSYKIVINMMMMVWGDVRQKQQ